MKRDRYEDDDDQLRRKRRKPAKRTPVLLIAGIAVFILSLVILASLGFYFAFKGTTKKVPADPVQLLPQKLTDPTRNWVDFQDPEGLYAAGVPVNPVHFVRPEGGSVFAPSKTGFFNSSAFEAPTADLRASLEVRVFTQEGLDAHNRAEEVLGGPKAFGFNTTRKKVIWAGREAIEDRDDPLKPGAQLSVRRRLFIGNRLYQLTLTGSGGRPTEAELNAFFDSFKLLKDE